MPAPSSPPSTGEPSLRARASYANPGMRVSDAERAEVADRLSKHYGDGRLDEEEFNKRLNQAMGATTQSDLAGLFADLPDAWPPGTEPPGTGRPGTEPPGTGAPAGAGRLGPRRPLHRILALILLIVVTAVIGHALVHLFVPWLLIAVLVFVWLRYGPRHRRGSPDG